MNSLRIRLLLWVLVPMLAALALTAVLSWRNAHDMALLVQDRQLLASAEMMAGQVSWQDDALRAETPPAALKMFASRERDRVYFQVLGAPSELLAGWPDLTNGISPPNGVPSFSSIDFHGKSLRMVTLTRRLYKNGRAVDVLVSVAESRYAFKHRILSLWWPVVLHESALLVLALVMMLVGLTLELRPLLRLRRGLQLREADDLRPLRTAELQRELQPIVDTINQYTTRLTDQVSLQKRFIADAAHQLRTPVALISAQLDYASHLSVSPELSETLRALRTSSRRLKDLISQLLSLSYAEASRGANLPRQEVNLRELAQRVLIDLSVLADDKGIDLGLNPESDDITVLTHPTLLHALLFNLVDNAVRYTPRGGTVTVAVACEELIATVQIDDTGPGIPPDLRAHVFERFSRGNASDNCGYGLGLAIVSEAAKVCGAKVELLNRPGALGLSAVVQLPTAEPRHTPKQTPRVIGSEAEPESL